jgi:hypothetical protein
MLNPIEQIWKEKKFKYKRSLLQFFANNHARDLDLMLMVRKLMDEPLKMDSKACMKSKVKAIKAMVDYDSDEEEEKRSE